MRKHICMICGEEVDINGFDAVLRTEGELTGFIHYGCQDTYTPSLLEEKEQEQSDAKGI